ncbi:MAG: 3-phosphoshikimate 1-carboxyvinyltransferase [Myxococcota bacterium]
MSRRAPDIRIEPRGPLHAQVRVPGSKSITNRALLIAALAAGASRLRDPLESDDTAIMCNALGAMGVSVDCRDAADWRVTGADGRLQAPAQAIFVGNSGTSARFLTAAATLAKGAVTLDGSTRMRERPIEDLVVALRGLGAQIELLGTGGCPPLRILGGGLGGGSATIEAGRSSQYVSAVLLVAPYAERDVSLRLVDDRVVSRPYVDLTLEVMHAFGAEAEWKSGGELFVRAGRHYSGRDYAIEPDASSATYPLCAAAIAGGSVEVEGIPTHSLQADLALLDLLERMGCSVERNGTRIAVHGPKQGLRALGEVDMNALPDAVLALAVVSLFAEGPTRIVNVGILRIHETDRLAALETEIRRLGAGAKAGVDSLEITPGPLHGAEIETYDDHRMAMAFSLVGLRVPGVVIRDPDCVSKTWPKYFDVMEHL